jgi:hypothetical protein
MGEHLQRAQDLGERLDLPLLETLGRIYEINPAGSGIL